MSTCLDNTFSKYQYGFRKVFSTQKCLLNLLEKRNKSNDRGNVFGALITDFSTAFHCEP